MDRSAPKMLSLQKTLRSLNTRQPFGIKEHVVASLIASSGKNSLARVEVYAAERLRYDRSVSASIVIGLVLLVLH